MSAAELLEQRIDVVRPLMVALAAAVVTDCSAVDTSAPAVLRSLRANPVPDDLLAGGLETLASMALQMAAGLRGEEALR